MRSAVQIRPAAPLEVLNPNGFRTFNFYKFVGIYMFQQLFLRNFFCRVAMVTWQFRGYTATVDGQGLPHHRLPFYFFLSFLEKPLFAFELNGGIFIGN